MEDDTKDLIYDAIMKKPLLTEQEYRKEALYADEKPITGYFTPIDDGHSGKTKHTYTIEILEVLGIEQGHSLNGNFSPCYKDDCRGCMEKAPARYRAILKIRLHSDSRKAKYNQGGNTLIWTQCPKGLYDDMVLETGLTEDLQGCFFTFDFYKKRRGAARFVLTDVATF
jgi:hypothetical protein